MSSLFGILGIGTNGMNANSFGVSTASHNASNVGTDGYSRRIARIESMGWPPVGGAGARANGTKRIIDPFVERRLINAFTLSGRSEAESNALSYLDPIFADGPGQLGDSLDAFEASLSDLAANPSDGAVRLSVLSKAEQLSLSFRNAAAGIAQARLDANQRIEIAVDDLNQKLNQIGSLNAEISKAEVHGEEAGDLRDKRDLILRDVAAIIPIVTLDDGHGGVNTLTTSGFSLVNAEGVVTPLRTEIDTGTFDARIFTTAAGLEVEISDRIDSGTLGGLISARDGALTDAATALDQLAYDISNAYNAVHFAGYGLDGVDQRNLFEVPPVGVTGAATAMAVSTDVAGNPDALAAAADPLMLPGDNRNAVLLQALSTSNIAAGNTQTATDTLSDIISAAGNAINSSYIERDFAQVNLTQLGAIREGVSGVSTDEEMVALMRFQRGYQASLKIIQVADEMLGELMNIKR